RDPFLNIEPAEWDRVIAVNLRGMFLVAQAVSRGMIDGGGAIVNMSSTNGLGGEGDYAHYNASKAGVILLTRTMAVELGGRGIRAGRSSRVSGPGGGCWRTSALRGRSALRARSLRRSRVRPRAASKPSYARRWPRPIFPPSGCPWSTDKT